MGRISSLAKGDQTTFREVREAQEASRATWRQVFNTSATDKEEGLYRQPADPHRSVHPSNSYGRSTTTSKASWIRMLQAMRSMAPGGWSDDRYEQSKHWTGVPYLCGHRTGEMLLESEVRVYRRDDNSPDGIRPIERGTEGYRLQKLLENPNNDDAWGDLAYAWNQQLSLTGMALTWMVPNLLGIPHELYPIPTNIAIPQPAINPDFPDGFWRIQPVYPYGPFSSFPTPASAVGAPIDARWMIRIKYMHPVLRYDGWSPLTAARLHSDVVDQMDKSRWYSMFRSLRPSAVLNFPNSEDHQPWFEAELERVRAEFEADHQGPENHGRLWVAPPGGEISEFGTSPRDMDYTHGWEQLVGFLMSMEGLTKGAAGMTDAEAYSTLYARLKQMDLMFLGPKCHRFGSQLTKKLAPFFGDDLVVKVKTKRIDDHDIMFKKIDKGQAAKCITKNQVLKLLDMAPTEESWGDDMAGDPTPMEVEQQNQQLAAQQQAQQPPQQPAPAAEEGGAEDEGISDAELLAAMHTKPDSEESGPGPSDTHEHRPQPEGLSQGSLGPRKNLAKQKLLAARLAGVPLARMKALNGNGRKK